MFFPHCLGTGVVGPPIRTSRPTDAPRRSRSPSFRSSPSIGQRLHGLAHSCLKRAGQ